MLKLRHFLRKDRHDTNNYQPVSILPSFPNVFEKLPPRQISNIFR